MADDKKRNQRSPRERAEIALGIEQRKVLKLGSKLTAAKAVVTTLEAELADAVKRRDYLAKSPDLEPAAEPELPIDDEKDDPKA